MAKGAALAVLAGALLAGAVAVQEDHYPGGGVRQAKDDFSPGAGGVVQAGEEAWPGKGGVAAKEDYYPSTGGVVQAGNDYWPHSVSAGLAKSRCAAS
ncbi:hypothetical protein [Kitasatospora cheerisanensis]|uniref:hypothetical protein n=1 Tax=Kitasatospora cheerisanensis TaxID=81942 RepID=UPI0012ECEDD8|nr:hypothetical protein [Kitasatospora cheerisanensis]